MRSVGFVNVRTFVIKADSMDDLVRLGTLTRQAAHFLEAAVVAGLNILVAGGTQAGNPTTSQSHTHGDYACTRECQRIRAAGDRVRSCRTMEN